MDICMQFYVHYLDIKSLAIFDTSLCNKKLRQYFLHVCKMYTFDTIDNLLTTPLYKYIYLRQINIVNIMIFNNEQLKLFYNNIIHLGINNNFINFLSMSNCYIDNRFINYILNNFHKLKILKIHNSIPETFDQLDEFKCLKPDERPAADERSTPSSNYFYRFNNICFVPLWPVIQKIIKYEHDEYLIEDIKLLKHSEALDVQSFLPIKFINIFGQPCVNIMNNIVGDLYDGELKLSFLEELYISGTNNLKYKNIILLLKMSNLKVLSIHFGTNEDILELIQYDIPIIEIINEKLKIQTIVSAIYNSGKRIVKLEINIKEINSNPKMIKINFGFTTDMGQKIFITFWDSRLDIPKISSIFHYCLDIDELKTNTIYTTLIIKKENIQFSHLKKIKIFMPFDREYIEELIYIDDI